MKKLIEILKEIEIATPIHFIIGKKYDFLDNDEEEGGPLEWIEQFEFVGMHRDSGNKKNYYVFDRPEGGTNIPEDFMKQYLKDKRVRYSKTKLEEIEIKPVSYPRVGEAYIMPKWDHKRTIEDIVDDELFDGGKRIKFVNSLGDWSINEFLRGLKDGSIKKVETNNLKEIEIRSKYPLYARPGRKNMYLFFGKEEDHVFIYYPKTDHLICNFGSSDITEFDILERLKQLNIPNKVEYDGEYDNGWRSYTSVIIDDASKYFNFKEEE